MPDKRRQGDSILHKPLYSGPPHAVAGLGKRSERENAVVAASSTGWLWPAAASLDSMPPPIRRMIAHARPLTKPTSLALEDVTAKRRLMKEVIYESENAGDSSGRCSLCTGAAHDPGQTKGDAAE